MLLFNRNLKYLLKVNSVTQQTLAEYVGVVHTTVSNYTKDKSPDVGALIKICQFFGIEPNDLIFKDLSTGIEPNKLQNIALPGNISGSNLLIPEDLQYAYNREWNQEYIQKLSYVNIPGIEGDARTFEVPSNSMNPVLLNGDFVACTPSSLAEVKMGQIYAIVIAQTDPYPIKITYAQPEKGRVLCIPANKEEFRAYHLDEKEIQEVWEAKLRLTAQITDPRMLTGNLEQRMKVLEDFFRDKFPDEVLK